jgi:hypothetical protein
MGVAEIRRLKRLEEENTKLKRLLGDLTLETVASNLCSNLNFWRTGEDETGHRYVIAGPL